MVLYQHMGTWMNTSEILAKHGLVIVQSNDVRAMMDYYRLSNDQMKTMQNTESYIRLWDTLHEVGLNRWWQKDD